MVVEVQCTKRFKEAWEQLPLPKQKTVLNKVRLLVDNPSSPSLNAHRYGGEENSWECYVDRRMRLIYEKHGGMICLRDLGYHAILDKAHRQKAIDYDQRFVLDATCLQLPVEDVVLQIGQGMLAADDCSVVSPLEDVDPLLEGSSNYFRFFQNTHMRILGVPPQLIGPLKEASSLEEALALPGLPEHTRLWLEELSTSPALTEVRFDSSRLLFRTTLDRLEGYCEGKIKQLMLSLQPEQQQYVELEHTPFILLKGVAGAGKTTIGIYRAIRLAEQGRRVLILTFSHTLAAVTTSLIEELIGPLPANLEIRTLHSIISSSLRSYLNIPQQGDPPPQKYLHDALAEVRLKEQAPVLKRNEKFFEEEFRRVIKGLGLKSIEEYKDVERYGRKTALAPRQREAVWKVYEAYQRRLSQARCHDWSDAPLLMLRALQQEQEQEQVLLIKRYDDVIVDEAQDFTPVELRVIQLLMRWRHVSRASSLMMLGDAAQTLYSRGFSWKQAGIQARGHTAILHKNYRNTRQIAEAAAQLLKQNSFMLAANEYIDPEWTQRQGPLPMVLKVPDRGNTITNRFHQIELVRNHILELVSDQTFRLSDFAILCRSNEFCQQCQQVLTRAGLRAVLRSDADFNLLEEQIKILTIHSAKGLEFPVVFLLGLIEGEVPTTYTSKDMEDEEQQLEIEKERTLCYVGMTRAADALYLLTVQGRESRFIDELAGKITLWQ